MGLFNQHFDRPGPGVAKDAPRKKGPARYFEVLFRDFGSFFKANLLCAAGYLPFFFLAGAGLLSVSLPLTILGGVLGGVLAGPCLAGLHDTILRALRDEPGFWWHIYKRAFKNNWKGSLALGGVLGLLVSGQLFMVWCWMWGALQLDAMGAALLALNILLTGMCAPFAFGQLVLMEMPLGLLFKNTLLLALSQAPWALLMAAVQAVYWIGMLLLFPVSLLWVVFLGFIPVTLFCQQIVYTRLDKLFGLDEQFKAKREQDLAGGDRP